MENLAIKVESAKAGYGDLLVLDNITFEVRQGDLLGIGGPNGAGKSTLIKLISGILQARKGNVSIKGVDIRKYKRKELARIMGVVWQIGNVRNQFKCYDMVLMGRFAHSGWFESKKDFEVTNNVMKQMEIYDLRNRLTQELSGGEFQRVRIAMALAQEPEILLLDEPTTHLDLHHEIEIFEILKNLNKNGLTIIVVSHNLNLISTYVKNLVLMNKGTIVKKGTPQEVINKTLIDEIYGARVIVEKHPYANTPLIFPAGR